MRPRIALLGATRADLDRAAALDIELIAITTPRLMDDGALGRDPAIFVHDLADPVVPAIVRAIHAERPIGACLAGGDALLEPAARINDALHLPWRSAHTVRLTRSPALFRSCLNEAGITPVASQVCQSTADLLEFGQLAGYPFVVKTAEQTRLLELPEQAAGVSCPVLAEEYLDGPQYSVESFTFHGEHVPIAITEQTVFGRDLGWFITVGRAIPAPLGRVAWPEVSAALTALGITEGPAHTELVLTGIGPRILSVRPGTGPDRTPDLIHLCTGLDLDLLALAWAAQTVPAFDPPDAHRASAIQYLLAAPGRIASIDGTHRARTHPGVVDVVVSLGPGDRLRPLRTPRDRPAHVLAVGSTPASARSTCSTALDHIRLEYHR